MLEDLRVVITGAAGTLGQAAAAKARAYGAHVTGLDIVDAGQLDNTDAYFRVDLLDREAAKQCFDRIGGVNALFNIAGGFAMGDTAYDAGSDQWEQMFRINVDTLRHATMAAVPHLRRASGGAVVNIGALGALSGQGEMSAYCCAKASVMRLTESLSDELRGENINVNAVLPSIIDTPANRAAMPDADTEAWVKPEQLAEVICFLASDRASAVHGALVPVRGLA